MNLKFKIAVIHLDAVQVTRLRVAQNLWTQFHPLI
jgi:hypothetical protein